MTSEVDREVLSDWLKGHEPAIRFVERFFYACHYWDDVVDGDKPRSEADTNAAFWLLLVELPYEEFFRENHSLLQPVIIGALLDWMTANEMEKRDSGTDRDVSYTLRYSILTVVTMCAFIVGGYEWALEKGPEIRRYGQRETLHDYKEGLTHV